MKGTTISAKLIYNEIKKHEAKIDEYEKAISELDNEKHPLSIRILRQLKYEEGENLSVLLDTKLKLKNLN